MTQTGSVKIDLELPAVKKLLDTSFFQRDGSALFDVTFTRRFLSPPIVQLGLNGFQGGGEQFRFRFEPQQITEAGFKIVLYVRVGWIDNLEISWLATDA